MAAGLNLLRKSASSGNVKAMKRLVSHLRASKDKTRMAEADEWERKISTPVPRKESFANDGVLEWSK